MPRSLKAQPGWFVQPPNSSAGRSTPPLPPLPSGINILDAAKVLRGASSVGAVYDRAFYSKVKSACNNKTRGHRPRLQKTA